MYSAHHEQEPGGDPPQALLVVDGGDEQDVEDEDLEPVLDDELPVVGPRGHGPAEQRRPWRTRSRRACCRFGSHRLPGQTAQASMTPEHVDAFDVQVAEPRPDLERPVDEQEHVADEQPVHRASSVTRAGGDRSMASCRPLCGESIAIAYLLAHGREKANRMGTTTPAGPNNWRNWLPLAGTYRTSSRWPALALWFFHDREDRLPWWTDIPVGSLAVALIGPAQHRL